jgi:hypothetical protein
MKVHVDKVGSVTRNLRLGRTVHLPPEVQAVEGAVIAARIHGEKSVYNQLEDVHGRLVTLHGGDITVAAMVALDILVRGSDEPLPLGRRALRACAPAPRVRTTGHPSRLPYRSGALPPLFR